MALRTSSIVVATIATVLILGASSIGFANAEVQVGDFSVSEAAAAYQEVPELACKLADAIYGNLVQSQPVDWEQVQELYEESGENIPFSLQQLAQGAVFGDSPPEIWQEYQQFYGDDTWLDTFITDGIDGIHADEEDGHRAESVYKIGSYANQFVHVLALIQSAATALDDPSAAPPAAFYLDVAIAIYHAGDCSLSDIKGTRAGEFDSSVDPNALTEAAFAAAQSDLTKENLETLLEEVEDAGLIAFLRAANRYANLMDQYAAAGDETLLRENQFEALAYFRVIEPIAQMLDADATELIENLFSQGEDEVGQLFLDDYQPVEEQVLPAINDILAAAGIDPEVFGTYTFDEGFDGYDPATYNTDDDE